MKFLLYGFTTWHFPFRVNCSNNGDPLMFLLDHQERIIWLCLMYLFITSLHWYLLTPGNSCMPTLYIQLWQQLSPSTNLSYVTKLIISVPSENIRKCRWSVSFHCSSLIITHLLSSLTMLHHRLPPPHSCCLILFTLCNCPKLYVFLCAD